MAITSLAALNTANGMSQRGVSVLTASCSVVAGVTATTAFIASSLGTLSSPGTAGSGGTSYTQGAAGSGYPTWNAAPSGARSYIGRTAYQNAAFGTGMLYDLLWGCSGFVTNTTTTAQTVSSTTLPSRNGVSVSYATEMWLVVLAAPGITQTNVQISYTNQSGTPGRTATASLAASSPVDRAVICALQAGDTGVQSVQSATFLTLTGTDGNVGLLLMNRVTHMAGAPAGGVFASSDFASGGLPQVADQAVLIPVWTMAGSNGAAYPGYDLEIIQG